MADTKKKWARRVAAWRACGLSSSEFCAGRDFTAGGLRHWAHRLRRLEAGSEDQPTPPIRMARVVRAGPMMRSSSPAMEQQGATLAPAQAQSPTAARTPTSSLVLEMQGVRIGVQPGFDPPTLASVLAILEQRGLQGRTR